MPPLVYDTRPNPHVGSIGDLLLRRGDIEAQRAAAVANAGAAATMASGQAWGGAVRDIGANVGGRLMQVGERMADPAVQLEKEQVTRAQRENRSRNIFEAELRNPANYTPEGTVDDAKITERLKKQDVGAWQSWQTISAANAKNAIDLREKLGVIQKNDLEITEKQRLAQEAQQQYLGGLAFHTEQALKTKADDPLHARDTFMAGLARAVADGGLSGAKARDVLLRTAQASPAQLQQVLGSLVPEDLRATLEGKAATTAKTTADAAHLAAETANLQTYGRATPPEAQHVTFRLDGKDVAGAFVPDPQGGKYFYNNQDVTARAVPIPAASISIHNDKDAKAAGTRGELVDSLIRGDLPPSMLSRRADDYNATLADASAKYRELTGKPLSIAKLQLDYEAAKKFTASMNSGQMVRYRGLSESVVNTIGEVERLGDALQQGGIQKWNSVKRSTIRSVYGNTPESELANQYVGAVNTLKEEFANLANGGYAPTDAAWHLANDQINGDFGFKDLRASLTEVQRLINYRTQAFNEQHAYTPGGDHAPAAGAPIKVGGFTVTVK